MKYICKLKKDTDFHEGIHIMGFWFFIMFILFLEKKNTKL